MMTKISDQEDRHGVVRYEVNQRLEGPSASAASAWLTCGLVSQPLPLTRLSPLRPWTEREEVSASERVNGKAKRVLVQKLLEVHDRKSMEDERVVCWGLRAP